MDSLPQHNGPPSGTGIDNIVEIWHLYRSPIILAVLAVLICARVYIHATESKGELVALPRAYAAPPEAAPVTEPKPARPDEKKPTKSNGPRRIKGGMVKRPSQNDDDVTVSDKPVKTLVFYSSVTTKTHKIAEAYIEKLATSFEALTKSTGRQFLQAELLNLEDIEFDDYFVSLPSFDGEPDVFYLFLIPSYNIDTITDTFLQHLDETHHDFRIDTGSLSSILGYSVFGFGDSEGWPTEKEGFCFQAKEIDKWMAKLTGRRRAYPVGMGDMKGDHAARLSEWSAGVLDVLEHVAKTGNLGEGLPGSGDAEESDPEDVAEDDDGEVVIGDEGDSTQTGDLGDVEDLGKLVRSSDSDKSRPSKGAIPVDFTSYGAKKSKPVPAGPKEMVAKNSPTYAALTKQGYAIVGSHSGVKICRWTKSALRGRGSCYKYSLYGINSHQCMETTPSLSCSNKCVFCWRGGTNPVGTTWRWVVDPPDLIFNGVKENHYKKIRMIRGMPGVRAERYNEALRIRHCALSLVGEPIFYPYINQFLAMLHNERISSFLVCNAQHPEQLAALKAVTQLYVSIDASNKDSLRKIDRPLHRDFWERFMQCLDILREKRFRHRTVYRLTLVKGFNVEEEAEGYAKLVERGLPCFVEVKGVTYCGTPTSSNAGLTMGNVPWYWEVCDFVRALEKHLKARGLNYGIAAEHAHSCCILLASDRFNVNGKWHTHIDYEKFFQLLEEKGVDGDWAPEDYMGPPTPEWALWGNGGFDPRDDRVDRKGRKIDRVIVRDRPEEVEV
ncbi:S-adenosyl-L-methionine-dependent tRNA 4-demethylwyosine synthase-like protein [Emericellopsis cladophorae]|uniref:tRNA 4-demethylwyosine synthase (AdoMet-dependent) n=1 Tax=Emericellopsis cladophorae TaxID=2686198 RepID=A0A9Q0BIB5_9HYPO|nr:S-adenosyl-L-methionine-dependent tRNA 4-demethylwyosine synthase-like protein [Emericellopsis cladophorae]KAI6785404.1 S-adenosyl-L-methionine-dependent tRNA 4-demethylwyosine synthase-like protein [Emericellopsis cladophorae]